MPPPMLERTPTAFVRKTGFVEAVQSDLPCPGWKNFPLCKKARSRGSERDDAIEIFLPPLDRFACARDNEEVFLPRK